MTKKPPEMPRRKVSTRGRKIEYIGKSEMGEAKLAADLKKIQEIEEEISECRINFRWDKEHLQAVKQAAKLLKMPYQRFIKQVIYTAAQSVLHENEKSSDLPSANKPRYLVSDNCEEVCRVAEAVLVADDAHYSLPLSKTSFSQGANADTILVEIYYHLEQYASRNPAFKKRLEKRSG